MSMTGKRVIAYVIDVLFIGIISSFLTMTPLNPYYDKSEDLKSEYETLYQEVVKEISSLEESSNTSEAQAIYDEYMDQYKVYLKESIKLSVYEESILIVMIILYYVVFAYFFGGETLGKRLMKIRISKVDGTKIDIPSLIIRTVILFGIPFIILDLIFAYAMSTSTFVVAHSVVSIASYILNLLIIISIIVNKENRGLHDMAAKTKVEMR